MPRPGAVSKSTKPSFCLTMPWQVASPRPVPRPGGLVVKNGSKRRAAAVSSMPMPVSLTERRTQRPALTRSPWAIGSGCSSSTFAVVIASTPPVGMASTALTTRFITTCSS